MLPTGAGKSLVYVLPAMLRAERNAPGVTVVVTPLLSLLADQLRRCDEMGVDAEAWSGATDPTRLERIERDLRAAAADDEGPTLTLLFTTPESLQTPPACARRFASRAITATSPRSRWTRRTASRSGATISDRRTSR